MDETQEKKNIFEDDEKLIIAAKQYLELVRTLKEQAKTDPSKAPKPQMIADMMHISIEELIELVPFAENDLGDFEREWIESHKIATINEDYEIIR